MKYTVEHLTGTCLGYTYPQNTYFAMYICDICYDKHIKETVFKVEVDDNHVCALCRIERNREKVDNYFKKNYPYTGKPSRQRMVSVKDYLLKRKENK